jgi:hypothetical protein
MSNVARRVPLVGGVVVLIAGVWLGTRLLREEAPSRATAAPLSPAVAARDPAMLPVPEATPAPAAPQGEPVSTPPTSAAESAGAVTAVPAPAAVWDDVYYVLDGLAKGGLTGEDALRLADALLARVAAAGPPEVSEGGNRLTWTVLDDPALGTLKLTQCKEPGEKQNEFEVLGQVTTRPGAYTGQAADGAEQSRFQLVLSADPNDKLGHVGVLSQVNVRQELGLTTERGTEMPIGGVLSVNPDGTQWTPMVVRNATGDDGKVSMQYTTLAAVPTSGSLADSRAAGLGQRLAQLRGR